MSLRGVSVDQALELLVPPIEPWEGDWEEVQRRAIAPSARRIRTPGRRRPRRAVGAAVVIGAVAAALVVTPAFGLRSLIADLLGRIDVPFTGKSAPIEVKRDFYDLGLGAPRSFDPGVVASQARQVATFHARGKTQVLWVAPTRRGGYCWQFSHWLTGCRRDRTVPQPRKVPRGEVSPGVLGVSYGNRITRGTESVSLIGGDILSSSAKKLVVRYADGSRTDVRFYFVSKPIEAGFFLQPIPAGHDTTRTRAVAVELLDDEEKLIARQPFQYETAAQRAKNLARQRAMIERMRRSQIGRPFSPYPPPTSGTPLPPLQRGEASGGSYYRATTGRAVIRMGSVPAPYDGCDIQGSYGHTWPDRNNSHSAIEIAFTLVGRRFLEDRSAARDLAGFARSPAMHRIRKLQGAKLEQALQARYGRLVTKLHSRAAEIAPRRVGYAISGATVTFVEESTTGRRFHVRFTDGKLRVQNVRPLALAF